MKENKLEGLGIFLMESLLPFRRLVSHMVTVGEPFFSIFFNNHLIKDFADIFYEEKRYNKIYNELKNSLEDIKNQEGNNNEN
jgi:hypothetical protein